VRKAINLVTSVKMPFPEGLSRNRARTERVWLELKGPQRVHQAEDRRWCYDHIAPRATGRRCSASAMNPRGGVYIERFTITSSTMILTG